MGPSLVSRFASAAVLIASITGCATPSERAEAIALDRNPLRDARAGELCRYRSIRDGSATEKPVVEDWIVRVLSAAAGTARVEAAVLGPAREPAALSPREPAFEVAYSMVDGAFSSIQMLRLFQRPDLTPKGMRVVLDREERAVEGAVKGGLLVVGGKTRDVRELTVTVRGGPFVRATYRVVIADDLPVLGIVEAELDETWLATGPDGDLREERRHDHLVLTDSHDADTAR